MRMREGGIRTDRLIVGAFGERTFFRNWKSLTGAPYPQPMDRVLAGPEVGWEHQTFRWKLVRGFRAWLRQEDLPLGPNWKVTTGLSLPFFGGDSARLRYHGTFESGQLSGKTYTWQRVDLTGRVESRGLGNAITHVEAGGAITGTAGLRVRVAADLGHASRRRQTACARSRHRPARLRPEHVRRHLEGRGQRGVAWPHHRRAAARGRAGSHGVRRLREDVGSPGRAVHRRVAERRRGGPPGGGDPRVRRADPPVRGRVSRSRREAHLPDHDRLAVLKTK